MVQDRGIKRPEETFESVVRALTGIDLLGDNNAHTVPVTSILSGRLEQGHMNTDMMDYIMLIGDLEIWVHAQQERTSTTAAFIIPWTCWMIQTGRYVVFTLMLRTRTI